MRRIAALGTPMPWPVDFGLCCGGERVYMLLTWCDGGEAEAALPSLPVKEQHRLGLLSGEILRSIHSVPAPETLEPWDSRFGRKLDRKLEKYLACGIRFEGDEALIRFVRENRGLLAGRPQCFQHGDYHVGNMVISPQGGLSVIDWNRSDFGDSWEEFNRIVWSAAASPAFARGQLEGYFGGEPPMEFFRLLALYIPQHRWLLPVGDPVRSEEMEVMRRPGGGCAALFDGMRIPVPRWYPRKRRTQRRKREHKAGRPFKRTGFVV
jgi:serine/threonine-protein kinase